MNTTGPLRISASAISRLPFGRIEIVYNGEVVAEQSAWKQHGSQIGT